MTRHSRWSAGLVAAAFVCTVVLPLPLAAYFGVTDSVWPHFLFMTVWQAWFAYLMFPVRNATLFLVTVTFARASQEAYLAGIGDDWGVWLVGGSVAMIVGFVLNRMFLRPRWRA